VPELARLPTKFMHEPWKAPAEVLEAAQVTQRWKSCESRRLGVSGGRSLTGPLRDAAPISLDTMVPRTGPYRALRV
jgi:hypothetical protein